MKKTLITTLALGMLGLTMLTGCDQTTLAQLGPALNAAAALLGSQDTGQSGGADDGPLHDLLDDHGGLAGQDSSGRGADDTAGADDSVSNSGGTSTEPGDDHGRRRGR